MDGWVIGRWMDKCKLCMYGQMYRWTAKETDRLIDGLIDIFMNG